MRESRAMTEVRDLFAGMNRTEKARAIELEALRRSGKIAQWWYEAWTFRLADRTTYTPDFVVQETDGALRAEETKGFWRDDARVKVKVFAALFPLPLVVLCPKKGGGWNEEHFNQRAA